MKKIKILFFTFCNIHIISVHSHEHVFELNFPPFKHVSFEQDAVLVVVTIVIKDSHIIPVKNPVP